MKTLLKKKPSMKSGPKSIGRVDRTAARMSEEKLVETHLLRDGDLPPLVYEAKVPNLDPVAWAKSHEEELEANFEKHRAVLLRGFHVPDANAFQGFVAATSVGDPLEYRDRSTPRTTVAEGVYVSTIYPNDQEIRLHNEGTYWSKWALKIYFCCLLPSDSGGATPLGDVRRVYHRIEPGLRQRFEDHGVLYVRNYGDGFGLPWQDVFQTDNPQEVEDYCRQNAIEWEWKGEGRLRTRQLRPAVRKHPHTGEPVWFNHGAFFHVTSLQDSVREMLQADFAEEDLPYNTYFGDGSRIEPEDVEKVRQAYLDEKFSFPWQQGDILLLDNMCFAHGRDSYEGDRKVIVAMTEPYAGEVEAS